MEPTQSVQPTPPSSQQSLLEESILRNLASVNPIFQISEMEEISKTLGLKNNRWLTWLWKSKSQQFSLQRIRKRSGGFRTLHIPSKQLREAQFRILSNILNKIPVKDYLWAFEKGRNVASMAEQHVGKDVVVSIDLEDYFGKVHTKHIQPILKAYGIDGMPGKLVTELCCYKFFLPQGGVTSPKLSNIVAAHTFGPKLKEYADDIGATLTIYADDVTLSFNGNKDVSTIIKDMTKILKENGGFTVNAAKTKVMTKARRQFVCGVVVNKKPNLAKEERNRLRAIINNISKNGVAAEAEKNDLSEGDFIATIRGRLNWYRQLNPVRAERLWVQFHDAVKPKLATTAPTQVQEVAFTGA